MEYTTVLKTAEAEFTEKKSRFIGRAYPVETEEEARQILETIRRDHWDATHNVFAYRVGLQGEIQRFSDDGEPGGTAGRPMLEVLLGQDIRNVLVIATRYFGGILLGTGGLVRAYTRSAQEAVQAAGVIRREVCRLCRLSLEYTQLGKIQYALTKENFVINSIDYTDRVELEAVVPEPRYGRFLKVLTEAGEGRIAPGEERRIWAARRDEGYVYCPDSLMPLPAAEGPQESLPDRP